LTRRAALATAIGAVILAAFPSWGRGQSVAGERVAYADELVARARTLELDENLQWIRLGHWRQPRYPTRHVYYESEADGMKFFLSPVGKVSPRAELEATLRAFATSAETGDEHPACRFPARFAWLDRELRFDRARMPAPACARFAEFVASMKPAGLTVVFSSYFMSRAASAYGHTFLRVIRAERDLVEERRQLLDTGIDYSATVTTSNAVLYAFLGIAGGFRGSFSKLPYYYKVREYNDFESRDLWEYQLALTGQQLTLVIAHLWELGHTYFDYFYMTENCSYHILGVVDVARPELGMVESLRVPVVPADTIKAITAVPGLVAGVTYRPSLDTQFNARISRLDRRERDLVSALAADPKRPIPASMPVDRQVAVLDAAADLVDLEYSKEILDPTSEGAAIKLALLSRRAGLGAPSDELVIEPPWRDQPHRAHDSGRLGFGGGWRRGVGPFASLTGRVNLHDHLDNPNGYPEQASIEFLPFEARLYTRSLDELALKLERVSLMRITQLNSYSQFNKKVAWAVNFGGERIRDESCADCFAGVAEIGGGPARQLHRGAVTLFALGNVKLHWAPDLDGYGPTGFRAGVGPRAGVRLRFRNDLLAMIEGEAHWFPALDPQITWSAGGAFRWHLAEHFAIDLGAAATNSTDFDGTASLLHYF
jgi:hypothetical protein